MSARHEEGYYEKHIIYFLVCKGLSKDEGGVARSTIIEEKRPVAGFKTGDLVKERSGGLPYNDSMLE